VCTNSERLCGVILGDATGDSWVDEIMDVRLDGGG
jgi:hypothetical protein